MLKRKDSSAPLMSPHSLDMRVSVLKGSLPRMLTSVDGLASAAGGGGDQAGDRGDDGRAGRRVALDCVGHSSLASVPLGSWTVGPDERERESDPTAVHQGTERGSEWHHNRIRACSETRRATGRRLRPHWRRHQPGRGPHRLHGQRRARLVGVHGRGRRTWLPPLPHRQPHRTRLVAAERLPAPHGLDRERCCPSPPRNLRGCAPRIRTPEFGSDMPDGPPQSRQAGSVGRRAIE